MVRLIRNRRQSSSLSRRVLIEEERVALANGLHHVYFSKNADLRKFVCTIQCSYAQLVNNRTAYQT